MPDDMYDALIIGGSFAGLAAAMQLGRARRRVLVIDAGEPRNRFAHASHGFPGQDGVAPHVVLDTFRAQVFAYPTVRMHAGMATDARAAGDDGFVVELESGESFLAARLVLATGVADELPDVPGLAERWGRTVLHCPYCHGYEVADGRLGLLATTEASMHLALLLPDWSADVTLFTNGAFSIDANRQAALAARGVRIDTRRIAALAGDAPALDGVRLEDGAVVALDALFTGTQMRVSPLAERLGCALEEGHPNRYVRTDERQATNVAGVFCAGDAARTAHNIAGAVSDGAMAGIAAHQSLALGGAPVPAASR